MDRLTLVPNDGRDAGLRGFCTEQDAIKRLAAYEDTGLAPQTISEILDSGSEWYDAHKEDRLLVLPCKAGDTVYSPRKNDILEQLVDYICMEEGEIYIHVSFYCDCDCNGCPHNNWQTTHEGEHYCDGEYGNGIFVVNAFGKTAFLTREEAEAALKEREGK